MPNPIEQINKGVTNAMDYLYGTKPEVVNPVYPTANGLPMSLVPKSTTTPTPVYPTTTGNPLVTAPKTNFSQSVYDQQVALNKLGAGLVTDGIYGPKTAAAVKQFSTPVVNTPVTNTPVVNNNPEVPPPTSAAGITSNFNFQLTPDEIAQKQAQENFLKMYGADANQEIDPNKIYQDKLKLYQEQINAIEKVYSDKLNQARIEGQGRIESRKFSQGRSGQIGSGTGEAGLNAVQSANTDIENSILNEKSAAISAIFSKVRSSAEEDAKAKTEAKKKGAEALLKFYDEAPAKRQARVSALVKQLLENNVTELSNEEIAKITDGLGITKEQLISEWESGAREREAKLKKEQQDEDKRLLEQDKLEAEINNLVNKNDFEASQKALDRALEEKKINVQWYNAQTSRINSEKNDKETQKNYDSKTIPTDIKGELFTDIVSNSNAKRSERKTLNDFIQAYPEIDTTYLEELYNANN